MVQAAFAEANEDIRRVEGGWDEDFKFSVVSLVGR